MKKGSHITTVFCHNCKKEFDIKMYYNFWPAQEVTRQDPAVGPEVEIYLVQETELPFEANLLGWYDHDYYYIECPYCKAVIRKSAEDIDQKITEKETELAE